MSENCKPVYKNLKKIASSGEQQYAVTQWADQNCENDEYLKQEVERLDYRINPYVRKRFNPILVDDEKSYGHQINNLDGTVGFNSDTEVMIPIDFTDESLLDMDISDCVIESYPTVSNGIVSIHKRAVLPKEEKLTENFNTLLGAIVKAKPAAAKGQYIKSCVVATTMGPGIKINPNKVG